MSPEEVRAKLDAALAPARAAAELRKVPCVGCGACAWRTDPDIGAYPYPRFCDRCHRDCPYEECRTAEWARLRGIDGRLWRLGVHAGASRNRLHEDEYFDFVWKCEQGKLTARDLRALYGRGE